ncbi:MAG: hypothetical protein A4E57_00897 [Syntrophorhabdaceae bacterium PtaU1.Bin034]|jgi:putative lipoic acid-binding regulatory protein|nr:MAG: hypothetical protein A4E57_00897 [Syntrophorhabdaceae bacterium PtaU1.Bin034]
MKNENNEKVFDFPCSYPLKVMGKNTNEFYSVVTTIIERHLTDGSEIAYASRTSSGDKYMSITATFVMESEEQLHKLYKDLNDHELVLMTL